MNSIAAVENTTPIDIDIAADVIRAEIGNGALPEVHMPLQHYHTENLYGRRIFMPAGTLLTSAVHKNANITIVLTGHATVVDEHGAKQEVIAPDVFVTPAGTQRILYIHSDSQWVTVHYCTEKDSDKVRQLLTCETMKEYKTLMLGETP